MNNIDILEEKEKRLRAYLAVLNEENILYKKEDAIEGIIKLFETLISENKKLKEENEGLKTKLDTLIEKYKELKEENDLLKSKLNVWENLKNENYIPKSKVEEELKKYRYLEKENIKNKDNMEYEECFNREYLYTRIIWLLQSLLGKE